MLASRGVLRSLVRSLVGIVFIAATADCQRMNAERERVAAEARASAERAARERAAFIVQVPLDPPLEKVRVPDSGLPCDVDDVFAAKCRRCHTTPARHAAPFELYTWADAQIDRMGSPLFVHIGRVVETGYMPLLIEAKPPVERLTPEEKKILLDWVKAGAPKTPCNPSHPEAKSSAPKPRRAGSP